LANLRTQPNISTIITRKAMLLFNIDECRSARIIVGPNDAAESSFE
jgi:hypothetical protein